MLSRYLCLFTCLLVHYIICIVIAHVLLASYVACHCSGYVKYLMSKTYWLFFLICAILRQNF